MISGRVYEQAEGGEPPVASARITVAHAGGSERSTLSDGDGFYELSVPLGRLSITAFKEGYDLKQRALTVFGQTVLNFSLTPE